MKRTPNPPTGNTAPAMSVRAAALWALVSQYLSFAMQFATSIVLARWFITPAQLGQFSIAFAAVTLVAFLQDFGVTRYVNGERDLTPEKLRMAFTISVAFAWSIALLALASAWPIAAFYADPALFGITLIVASSYLLVPLAIVPQATCQRRMDYRSNAMIEIGSSVANAATALVLALLGYGALALAWGAFAQQAARLVISQWRSGGMLPWPLRISEARAVLALGGTNTVQVVCQTVSSRAPELALGAVVGNVAVGLFSRATGLALQLRTLIAGAVTGVFYPAFRRLRDSGEPLGPPYLRVVAAYTGVTWPAMAGIAVLADPVVRLLYGERWMEAAPLLAWVAFAQMFQVAVPLNADLPLLLGRHRTLIRVMVLETIASIALLAVTAPFGLLWVAISRAIHGIVWVAMYAPLLCRSVGLGARPLIATWMKGAVATVAAIVPALAGFVFWAPPGEAGFLQVLATACAGVALWFVALVVTAHPLHRELVELAASTLASRRTGGQLPAR